MPVTPQAKSHLKFVHCAKRKVVTDEEAKLHRHQTLARYQRLLDSTNDPKRKDRLVRLIQEAQKMKTEAGDSEYLYLTFGLPFSLIPQEQEGRINRHRKLVRYSNY
jgi:hypothetical protein